jgi:hypothetical protein
VPNHSIAPNLDGSGRLNGNVTHFKIHESMNAFFILDKSKVALIALTKMHLKVKH